MESFKPNEPGRSDIAHIGKSVVIKGELSGSEDLYLDGEVEGSIELRDHSLTVGPNGRVRANINANEVVVHGRIDGNISATGKVELRKSAVLAGDIVTQRIVIEDGAFFKGGIDIQKTNKDQGAARTSSASAQTSTPVTSVTTPGSSTAASTPAPGNRG